MPRLALVILSETTRGEGVKDDPLRRVDQVFDLDGNLIAERDAWKEAGDAASE